MKAILLNAYSRKNAGDGLLVDEARSLLSAAGIDLAALVAWDPDSFRDLDIPVLHPLTGDTREHNVQALLRSAVVQRTHPTVDRWVQNVDIAVAVGGGYLRASSAEAYAKSYLAHRAQLAHSQCTTPFVYLPQSVGPHPPRLFPGFSSRLQNAAAVFVRDDRSLVELRERGVLAHRMPDCAVLAASQRLRSPVSPAGRVAVVARELKGSGNRGYRERIRELTMEFNAELLLQSERGANDDRRFYRRLGFEGDWRSVEEALNSLEPPSVIVSVRLHGALQSILAGVPSVHLSYERKGWGAFGDMGLDRYVVNAKNFDVKEVGSLVSELLSDGGGYWREVGQNLAAVEQRRHQLVEMLRSIASREDTGEI